VLDLIVCDGCGRSFQTQDGDAMLAAITGPCPDCGGQFVRAGSEREDAAAPKASPPKARTR
jgi:rRNA maturation endonuclease Nob1